jgi:hypothetical protein
MPAKNRRTIRPPGPMNDAIIQAGRTVFAYASTEHQRRHGPRGYTNYRAYKPWLRDEFAFRCVYCLSRERWCPNGHEDFAVDHLMPRSTAPGEARDYDNLLGFPDSLPDFAARRAPAGNTRPEGIVHSHFARRQRGELPRAY